MVQVPELEQAGYARLHEVLPAARRSAHGYPWWVHHRWHALLAVLVALLVCIRGARTYRWVQRRRASA